MSLSKRRLTAVNIVAFASAALAVTPVAAGEPSYDTAAAADATFSEAVQDEATAQFDENRKVLIEDAVRALEKTEVVLAAEAAQNEPTVDGTEVSLADADGSNTTSGTISLTPSDYVQAARKQLELAEALGYGAKKDLTERWKRALADTENTRRRADAAQLEGREYGIALAVEALAPALDALSLGIEAARSDPDADGCRIVAHLECLQNTQTAVETGLKALGVRAIAPDGMPFDRRLHEAMGTMETDKMKAGQVMALHLPGYAIGQRLIRPARVTVSAPPLREDLDWRGEN